MGLAGVVGKVITREENDSAGADGVGVAGRGLGAATKPSASAGSRAAMMANWRHSIGTPRVFNES